MRSYVPLAALAAAICAAQAGAQEADGGPHVATSVAPALDGGAATFDLSVHDSQLKAQILQELQADEDLRLAKMRVELRDQIRAELTTAQAPPQEFEELPEEKPKLQLLELNGYFRVRPNLYQNLWLGWTQPDPLGYYPYARPYTNPQAKTILSADTRFRVEPTLNISEDIRIRSQIDVLDNLVLGSTPDLSAYAPSTVFTQSQVPPSASLGNSLQSDSLRVKRVWAEVTLPPIGQLRFGRMGNHWGLGMYQNDGNCIDCDYGNTVDRILLMLKIANHYVIPMIDWVGSGPLYNQYAGDQLGQPVAFDRLLGAYQYGLQIVRRDSDQEVKALTDQGKSSFNYGFYGTIREQSHELVWDGSSGYGAVTDTNCGTSPISPNGYCANGFSPTTPTLTGQDARNATFYVPDLWARYKSRRLRLEAEAVYINGSYTINDEGLHTALNTTDHKINVNAFGAAVETEYKFLNDLALSFSFDAGLATGNHAYGFGNQPGRTGGSGGSLGGPFVGGGTPQGSLNGSPVYCPTAAEPCPQNTINAFNFSPDYRVDQILWRQIIGNVVDAFYLKPTVKYRFLEGLDASLSGIYSQAMLGQFTPGQAAPLGMEFDLGLHYATDDGFLAGLDYGILIPLAGLDEVTASTTSGTSVAQSLRLFLGVKY